MRQRLLRAGILVAVLLQAAVIAAQQDQPSSQEALKEAAAELTKDEKAELIRRTLEFALGGQPRPNSDSNVNEEQRYFLLSAENMSAELVPWLEGITLTLLEPREIQELADSRGDHVYYLRFKGFKVEGPKVIAYLDKATMCASNATCKPFNVGYTVEFRKEGGEWGSRRKSVDFP